MEREHQPIIIVDETRIDVVLHVRRLAAELRAQIRNLHRLAVLIFSLVGDLAGLGFPDPCSRDIDAWKLCAPGIADRFDLPKRIETIDLGKLLDNWRTRLRPGSCSKDQHPKSQQSPDRRNTARICHGSPPR